MVMRTFSRKEEKNNTKKKTLEQIFKVLGIYQENNKPLQV